MGKTMSRRTDKFSAYDFDDKEEKIEIFSQEIMKKFNCRNPNKTANQNPSPIDKYTFLRFFSEENKGQDKKSGCEPVYIEDTEEVVKGCTSSLEFNVLSNSSDCDSDISRFNNHNARCCLSKVNSYTQGPEIVGTSTSSNHRDDTQHNFVSDSELIGITSDDDDDSIELNSTSISNCHHVDDEALLEQQVLVSGVDGGESDMAIVILPNYIHNGDELFFDPRLTFTSNHVKLEVWVSVFCSGPLNYEWTVADIVSIESRWSEKCSKAALLLHLRSKDMKLAINAEDSGIVKLNCEVTHRCWPKIQDKIWALDDRYKETWNTDPHVHAVNIEDVLMDNSSHPFHDLGEFAEVTFPKGDLDAVCIGRNDIQLLQPRTFINDTIIDFYMKYLKYKVKREEVPKFHCFSSFFYRKLADCDGDLSSEHEGKAAFLRVRKWTRKLNLFEKDYIFIPVNFSFHWSLIVICHPGEVANIKDEDLEKLCKVPCILHMDSIKGSHRGLQKIFQSYLLEEWKERHNDLVKDISSRFQKIPFIGLELPQQENLFDCGLFLLHYTELFMEEAPENFNPYKIPKSSKFLTKNWFTPVEASSKRAHIRELIYRIAGDYSRGVCASDRRSPSESAEVDECNNGGQFLNEFHNSTDTCLVNHLDCTADQKFATKQLDPAPQNLQCDGEPKLNNVDILDLRYNTRSPSDRYYHPARQYTQSKSVMSPVEEHEECEEQKAATPYGNKELKATESSLLPGISVVCEEVEKQDKLHGNCGSKPSIILEMHVSGNQKSAVLDFDVEEYDEISSTSSDEFAACVVEDSEEVCETRDDNECQSSANHRNKASSSDQEANSSATTSLPSAHMLNDGLAHCVVSDSNEQQPKTPGIKVDFGSPFQQGVTPALSSQVPNFIEITDSTGSHTPLMLCTKERRNAKRPRNILLEEEEPLHKRLQAIVID